MVDTKGIKKINKRDIIIISLSLIIIVLSVFLSQKNDFSINEKDVQSESFLTNVLIDNDVYLAEIEKICPYYEPNGVVYKECLSDLFTKQELALNQQFEKLVADLNNSKIVSEKPGSILPSGVYEYLVQDLKGYKESWKPYIGTACRLKNTGSIAGSGYSAFLMTCMLNEIKKFSGVMSEIDKEYNLAGE